MLDPAIFWSTAHALITAALSTQYTSTSSIPAALSLSCPARYPGTWHVDQVGVKAPGRPTTMVFLPARREVVFTCVVNGSWGDAIRSAWPRRVRGGDDRVERGGMATRFLIVLFSVPRDRAC
jgi:hypothetical protein